MSTSPGARSAEPADAEAIGLRADSRLGGSP